MDKLETKKTVTKIVIKIGTSTLTKGTGKIYYAKIEDLAKQILILQKQNYKVTIVSSGAIASAQFSNPATNSLKKEVVGKQAMAAIGQVELINIYKEVFDSFNLKIAQCLVTSKDFEDPFAKQNIYNTTKKLLNYNYIPIFNENDVIMYEEIISGDNDKLSAMISNLLKVNILIIASDINGLYDKDPNSTKEEDLNLIEEVYNLKPYFPLMKKKKGNLNNKLGTGSISSKIEAANICMKNNIAMWLINGTKDNFLLDAINQKSKFTKFIKKKIS